MSWRAATFSGTSRPAVTAKQVNTSNLFRFSAKGWLRARTTGTNVPNAAMTKLGLSILSIIALATSDTPSMTGNSLVSLNQVRSQNFNVSQRFSMTNKDTTPSGRIDIS
jgi:hypothetical protein